MPSTHISIRDTHYFSSLICDYLDESTLLKPLFSRFPNLDNFKSQIHEKNTNFDTSHRPILVETLRKQYESTKSSKTTIANIDALLDHDTFTITTGHQLNLFTGPLYFLYKIISVINLTEELKEKYPSCNFVPVYWMATEDHDFDEINFFNYNGTKLQWSRESSGAVGRINTEGLEAILATFKSVIGVGKNADVLLDLFQKTYIEQSNLTEATRYLTNELFKSYGLVIIDGDDKNLKALFSPHVKQELFKQTSYNSVQETNKYLKTHKYKVQVNPREINLFYLKDNNRNRLLKKKERFFVNDTDISFSKSEIMKEVECFPERFSPNVIMRPLYQEVILPNLCYIGGGGELAYWLQLKSYFNSENITFPMLLLRNSVLITTSKQIGKADKLGLSIKELFKKQEDLIADKIRQFSTFNIDFTPQIELLQNQFLYLHEIAKQTDKSFSGAVSAQEKKQLKGLINLEKRLLKAQKRKLNHLTSRIIDLQNELFPRENLQERQLNFSELYMLFGTQLIEQLVLNLQPLKKDFLILEM